MKNLYVIIYSTECSTKNWGKIYHSKREVKADYKMLKVCNPTITFKVAKMVL